ncbi:sulfatase-like hydrolase/transferase [Bythopirellula polymerisocia]|nr:sulfatase-like hydrolase/transferase [Bythopirellula polymerisocia]
MRRPNSSEVVGILLFWILSALFITRYERSVFDGLPLLLSAMNLSGFDSLLVSWSLLCRTLLLTLPLVTWNCFSLLANGRKWLRVVVSAVHFCVLAWLVISVKTLRITGANISYYLDKALLPSNWQWCDNYSAIAGPIVRVLLTNMICVIGLHLGCQRLQQLYQAKSHRPLDRKLLTGIIGLAGLLILGVFPIRGYVTQPLCLEQLYASMTLPLGLFNPDDVMLPTSLAFGGGKDDGFLSAGETLLELSQVSCVASNTSLPIPASRPHVVMIITESLQFNSLSRPDRLPLLGAWAEQGIQSEEHYCNSNCSQLGTFALLYGRLPLAYEATLNAQVAPTATSLFKSMGYQTNLIASCSFEYGRMNEFFRSPPYEHVSLHVDEDMPWYSRDQKSLEEVAKLLKTAKQPQFVTVYLMSTHYGYQYPPEYDVHPPANIPAQAASSKTKEILENRYAKATAFLDREFQRFTASLDLSDTIVVITGDHGESIYDDGFLSHGTRLSQYQSGTPLVIRGAGIPRLCLTAPTGHVDVLPTLLHAIHGSEVSLPSLHGRSLLNGNRTGGQFLVQSHPTNWKVQYVDRAGRLGLKIPRGLGDSQLLGFYNAEGQLDHTNQRPSADAPLWRNKLAGRLQELSPQHIAQRILLHDPTQGTLVR